MTGHTTKVSVHPSGQIHFRMGPRDLQKLAPLLPIGIGWSHALEIRFLVDEGVFRPPARIVKLKATQKAYLVDTPENHILLLNLILGSDSQSASLPYPSQFEGATVIWQTKLSNDRPVRLLGRVKRWLGDFGQVDKWDACYIFPK